jgi:hypothetical protein
MLNKNTTKMILALSTTAIIAGSISRMMVVSEQDQKAETVTFIKDDVQLYVEVIPLDVPKLASVDLLSLENKVITQDGVVLKHDNDLTCLANNIYFESRNQPIQGQIAVGYATIHRVGKFRNANVCDAVMNAKFHDTGEPITHKCHFSWMCDGKPIKVVDDMESYLNAKIIAKWVMERKVNDPTGGADHYLTKAVEHKTDWVKDMKPKSRRVIGDHVFYQWKPPVKLDKSI